MFFFFNIYRNCYYKVAKLGVHLAHKKKKKKKRKKGQENEKKKKKEKR